MQVAAVHNPKSSIKSSSRARKVASRSTLTRFVLLVIAKRWSAPDDNTADDVPWLEVALATLDKTLAEEPVDEDRVYLTGLSMGGFGAWFLAAHAPERFAGVVPVCGGGHASLAPRLRDVPIWTWHGDADRAVPVRFSREMVRAVRQAGGIAHYTELPGVGHASWNQAYALDGGALDWLWSRRRGERYLGHVMACDQSVPRIALLALDRAWDEPSAIAWEWRGEGLTEEQKGWFAHPTDAKPSALGAAALVTASGGGVFRVRVPGRTVDWAVHVGGNPHSVAELPDGSIAVASSTDDRLVHLDPRDPDREPSDHPVSDAHGAHWDAAHERLWVLGGKQMFGFALVDGALDERVRVDLPATERSRRHERHGGHDLVALPGTDRLLLSDMDDLWVFDTETHGFVPFGPLPNAANVKSIAVLRPDGPFALMQATESWWSDRARFVGVDLERRLPGARFYKLRSWP